MEIDEDPGELDQPWTRTLPARVAREAIVCGVFDAIVSSYARREISGREHLEQIDGPVIFVANHCSHVDTPVLLRSLPGPWRRRTAVAAAADYFYTGRLLAAAVSLAFCTVPLERRGGRGTKSGTSALEPLVDAGWSVVVFAEGTRSRDGRVGPLRTGAAVLAAEHGLPIVPIHIDGTHAAMPTGAGWMTRPRSRRPLARHTLGVSYGPPIHVGPRDDRFEVMENVRLFMQICGAETTPDPKLAARRAAAATAAQRVATPVAEGRSR